MRRDTGTKFNGPLATIHGSPTNTGDPIRDEVFRWNPQAVLDDIYDLTGSGRRVNLTQPLVWNDTSVGINAILTTDTKLARTYFIAPASGQIKRISFVGEDALAANDTNYVTFTALNRVRGAGSTNLLVASGDANTTKATGGSAIAAKTARDLTLNATTANLYVTKGDVIEVAATVSGTLANAVDAPQVQIEIAALPEGFYHRITRTAGSPTARIAPSGSNGSAVVALGATNEAMVSGLDPDDIFQFQVQNGIRFEAKLSLTSSLVTTNQRLVIGLASAYNSTFDSTTANLWFRLEASGALLLEGDDDTTNTDDQAAVPATTLALNTNYVFEIDATDLNRIVFKLNGQSVGTISAPLLGGFDMQPVIWLQKDSGTGTPAFTVDYIRVMSNRT